MGQKCWVSKIARKGFDIWQKALTPDVMVGLSKGEVRLPPGPVIANESHVRANQRNAAVGTLKQGMHSDQVEKLQVQLGELGYLDNTVQPDGKFGPRRVTP